MVFERIKAHFINKKQPKVEQNWYVIEFEDDKAFHIVDQKMLETMLGKNVPMGELFSCDWTENKGWHIEEDNKVYERHALNKAGLDFYERVGVVERGPKCVEILENMNNNIYPFKYDFEANGLYMNVCFYLDKNRIKSIRKYDKEMEENRVKEKILYNVELKNDETIFVVNKKVLELMLSDGQDLHRLSLCGYASRLGWHKGEDGKIYERYTLSESGGELYNEKKIKGKAPKYLQALDEINAETSSHEVEKEKQEILFLFRKSLIKKVYKRDENCQKSSKIDGTDDEKLMSFSQ